MSAETYVTYEDPASIVTDHALVRWLERVCGFPMEEYRSQLASQIGAVAQSGAATYISNEAVYVFADQRLITVKEPQMFLRRNVGRMRQATTKT